MDCDENCCRISAISGGAIAVVVVIVILAGAGLLIGLLVDSIDTVNYDEYGLNWSRYTKKVKLDKVYEPGRYVLGVGHRFLTLKRVYKTIQFTGGNILRSRTFDGLSLSLDISFQYRIAKEDVLSMFNLFGLEYEPIYDKIARDVLRDVASSYNATQFFDQRKQISDTMKTELGIRLAEVKGTLGYLQLRNIDLPDAYENIIEEKEIVRQQIQKARFDREAQTVVAETNVLLSQKTAEIELIKAEAVAKSIIIQADATANSTKVRVTAESEAYSDLSQSLGFNSTELLSYLWIQAVQAHSSSQLIINLDKPAVLNIDEP